MTTFGFKKDVNDIEEPALLPMDWYKVKVNREPEVRPNGVLMGLIEQAGVGDWKLLEGKKLQKLAFGDPKAGFTLFVNGVVVSDDEEFTGREITVMLPYPCDADEERRDKRGQVVYDSKMSRVVQLCEKANGAGSVRGKEANLGVGAEFKVFVKQGKRRGSEILDNQVDIFAGFRAADEEIEEIGADFELPE